MTQTIISVIGGLALFLLGMKTMSEGLQKVAGAKMRHVLSIMTDNRFMGVLTGLVVTSAVQSSSATTVMLVGFVHAGLISLSQSIGVIMGANIGTTFTGWLVALLGFKIKIAAMALPAVALGFFPRFFGAKKLADWGEVLVGFGLLFIGLDFIKDSVGHLSESAVIHSWMSAARADVLVWRLVAVFIGAAVTLIVQSSSATMAITMTLAAQGLIDVQTACALVIGENIGTTVTANIAAISASTTAKRAARAHFIFNIFGAVWASLLFGLFFRFVDHLMPGAASDTGSVTSAGIATRLAAFHTAFNIINTGLFLPFTNQLAKIATRMVKEPKREETRELKFIDPNIINLPPMALHAARREMKRMLDEVESMLSRVLMLISSPDKKLKEVAEAIEASEHIVDVLEKEITAFLVSVARLGVSLKQSHEISGIINAVSDIERMGDHCEILLRLLRRRYDGKFELCRAEADEAMDIGEQALKFITLLKENMEENAKNIQLMKEAQLLEHSIDNKRWRMREDYVERLREGTCGVDSGLIFIDMLTSFEKIGDHSFNVAQMLAGER